MASERTDELYKVLLDRGYPKKFCVEVAYKNMNTDYTATRMLGYLYRVSEPRIEDLVDEMFAILSDRDAIIRKKEMEHAQAVMNEMYYNKDCLDVRIYEQGSVRQNRRNKKSDFLQPVQTVSMDQGRDIGKLP